MQLTPSIRSSYAHSWANMKANPARIPTLTALANKFAANKARYEAVETATGVPWYFVAIVHERESGCDFATYLGNGDPLDRPSVHVPAGRGPFASWSDGAIDALKYQGLDKWTDWSLEGLLYQFEAMNGWGYLRKTNSPYVWSYSNLYSQGKYVSDGRYSPTAIDQQPGCAPMLWQMIQMGIIPSPAQSVVPEPSDDVKWVQSSLNKLGANLTADGYDGVQTQAAIRQFQTDHNLVPDGIVGSATRATLEAALKAPVPATSGIFSTIIDLIKKAFSPSSTTSTPTTQEPSMGWVSSIFLSFLGSAQIQALIRKALTIVGTALLVKLGLDPTAAGGLLSQVITALGGVVAIGSSAFLSAQNASEHISNPTLIKSSAPSVPTA